MTCTLRDLGGAEAASGRSVGVAAVRRDDRAADLGGAERHRRPGCGGRRRGAAVHRGRAGAGRAHRGEPGGARARRARLVVLDRRLRRLGRRRHRSRRSASPSRSACRRARSPGTSATAPSSRATSDAPTRRSRPCGTCTSTTAPSRSPPRSTSCRSTAWTAARGSRSRTSQAVATTDHAVEERQAVVSNA